MEEGIEAEKELYKDKEESKGVLSDIFEKEKEEQAVLRFKHNIARFLLGMTLK